LKAIRKYKGIIEGVLLLGIAIVLAVAVSSGINSYLANPKHPIVSVTTGSMLPIYNGFQDYEYSEMYPFRGDILLIRRVPINEIKVGDVIIFDTPYVNDPVVHRVVAKWEENGTIRFKTNGDNRVDPDSWYVIGEDDIIHGVVVFRVPHVGWFLLVIQTTLGRLVVLSFAIILLFLGGDEKEKVKQGKDESCIQNKSSENQNLVNNLNIIQKGIIFERNIASKQTLFYTAIIFLIIFSFLGFNILGALLSSPDVNIYAMSDNSLANPLEDKSTPFNLTNNYSWKEGTQDVYFFPVKIEITSGGLFNNIDYFEIKVNETQGLYRWSVVYNFIGKKVIEGAVIAYLSDLGVYSASITLEIYSRGLLASPTQIIDFKLLLGTGG